MGDPTYQPPAIPGPQPWAVSPLSMLMMGGPFSPSPLSNATSIQYSSGGPNMFTYCSSSVTSYTTDEQGRQQVYQKTREYKAGPNGVKETKEAVRDTSTGHHEMAIGHHIYDKAHIKKKSKNVRTGDEEQTEEFVNINDNEVDQFEQTWGRYARGAPQNSSYCPAITNSPANYIDAPPTSGNSKSSARSSAREEFQKQSNQPSTSSRNVKSSRDSQGRRGLDILERLTKNKKKRVRDAQD